MRRAPPWIRTLTLCSCFLLPGAASAAGLIASSQPEQGATVVGRRPRVIVTFTAPVERASVAVTLDAADVTRVASITEDRVAYTPVVTLPPGMHTLVVLARDRKGAVVTGALSFASRHSALFETVEGTPELGLNYEYAARKPEGATTAPDSKLEANVAIDMKGHNRGFTLGGAANLAYYQPQPGTEVAPGSEPYPPEGAVNLMDYLFSASYGRGAFGLTAEVGTLQIDLGRLSAGPLSRRGTRLGAKTGPLEAAAFSIQSASGIELEDPAGIGGAEDHLYGFTAGASLFGGGLRLAGRLVAGGDPGSYPGIAGGEARQGRAMGAMLTTDFFERRFVTEFGVDRSTIDADAAAGTAEREDSAWSARVAGTLGRLDYEAGYERRGRDFEPISNPQLEPDLSIAKTGLGLTLQSWRLSVSATNATDNVDDDPTRPRIGSLQGTVEASYTGFAKAPFGVTVQVGRQETVREVAGTEPVNLANATLTGWANLAAGPASLGLQASESRQDDGSGGESATTTLSATPSLNVGWLTLAPGYSFTRSSSGGVAADNRTQVVTLDVRSSLFGRRLSADVAGSWTESRADDASVDTASTDATARVALEFGPLPFWPTRGSVAAKAVYSVLEDRIAGGTTDDLAVALVLTLAIPAGR